MRIFAKISIICVFIFTVCTSGSAADASATLLQRDWMINLVDTLGYAFGLPDEPADNDYIKLLEGNRTFRFEAETVRDPRDIVGINNFDIFGAFSGEGWVNALAMPTQLRLNFLLPHSGTYHVYAAVRLAGHSLSLGDKSWMITENYTKFQRVALGEASLSAGSKTMTIDLPANGSIDYVEFVAPPLPRIAPRAGWQPDNPLQADDLAVTTTRALELESFLPLSGDAIMVEAESIAAAKGLITDQGHLGQPHGGTWIRNGVEPAELSMPFKISENAVYNLYLSGAADKMVSGSLDQDLAWETTFPPYLKEKNLGNWFLNAGSHELGIHLPPSGGIDLLTIRKRRSTELDYRTLCGLAADGSFQTADANRLLSLLSRLQQQRD